MSKRKRVRELCLCLDSRDYEAVKAAVERRLDLGPLPDGCRTSVGRVLAEICRGWMERLDHKPADPETCPGCGCSPSECVCPSGQYE